MKKRILFIFLLLAYNGKAQSSQNTFGKDPIINLENWDKQRLYFGYYLGFNSLDFAFNYKTPGKDVLVKSSTGFNVGVVADLRLIEYINFRFEPGLAYSQRDLIFPDAPANDQLREVRSTYIHFPFLFKFSSLRTGNIRPYVLAGLSTSFNLSSNANAKEDNFDDRFRMTKWSTNYELGLGIDFYFEYFKFSPSIRGIFGINNELIPDNDPNSPWTGNIQSMKTRGIFVVFTFH